MSGSLPEMGRESKTGNLKREDVKREFIFSAVFTFHVFTLLSVSFDKYNQLSIPSIYTFLLWGMNSHVQNGPRQPKGEIR
jgi:nitrate reductase NapE component